MKPTHSILSFAYLTLAGLAFLSLKPQLEASLPESLAIEVKNVLQWDTSSGQTYQLQKSTNANSWENIATAGESSGNQVQHEITSIEPNTAYRIEYTTNVTANDTIVFDEAFGGAQITEGGDGDTYYNFPSGSEPWAGVANLATNSHTLYFTEEGSITFTAYVPDGGDAHIYFRFERLPHPDVVPYFNVGSDGEIWQDANGSQPSSLNSAIRISGSTPIDYTVSIPSQGNNTFRSFIFYIIERDKEVVLRNVEVWDDGTNSGETLHQELSPEIIAEISWPSLNGVEYDVMESSNLVDWSDFGTDVVGDGSTKTITMTMDQASRFIRVIEPEYELFAPSNLSASPTLNADSLTISWSPSNTPNVDGYRVYYSADSNNLNQYIDVTSGNSVEISGLTTDVPYYFAVVAYRNDEQTDQTANIFSATPTLLSFVPLFNNNTVLEEETIEDNDYALITRGADRGRARHAREPEFQEYDLYLPGYWDGRAYEYEIIDRVGKDHWNGTELQDSITINFSTEYPLYTAEIRAFYLGQTTKAQYIYNYDAASSGIIDAVNGGYEQEASPRGHRTADGTYIYTNSNTHYTTTIYPNQGNIGDLKEGDYMEIELSPFGLPTTIQGSKANYYGTAFLYVIGQGMKPWYGTGSTLTSQPLPEYAVLGGQTTQHVPYSNEPDHSFKQMAYNLAPDNGPKFMNGRRLHHTNFQDGSHSEPNPIFYEHRFKLGPDYINSSCVDCHTNNGRAIPNNPGNLMEKSIVRVGIDSEATIHPDLGTVLQVKTTSQNTGPIYNEPSTIYVETTGFSSPYYKFYLDEAKTIPFEFTGSGESSLVAGQTYTFIRLDEGHPFDMYYSDSYGAKTYLVNNLSKPYDASKSFTINSNTDFSSYTFTYECKAHPSAMNGSFNLVNASNAEKTAYRTDYTEIPGTYGDGSTYSLRKPNYIFAGEAPDYYSVRSAPQLIGLGLLEAIEEFTILELANTQASNTIDGISGRINRITDPETGDIRLGRFGYKASKARVSQHIASALNTDMGVSTTIYPTIDFKNTEPSLEINDTELDLIYRYVALLAVMPQRNHDDQEVIAGKTLFTQANCVACHVETLQTSDYHPLTELRSQTIHPYTDLLLHDMGPGLADNMGEGLASGSEWRTAPLWNIGYTEGVSGGEAYLHDGRARTLEEAILWHGGEAEASKEAFRTMSASNRDKLITFLKSL